MNIKVKSHLKHINIKIYSKKKIIKKNYSFPKHPKTAKTFENIYKYVSVMFLGSSGVLEHIPSVPAETTQNSLLCYILGPRCA